MRDSLEADAWVATALGDPTRVLTRRRVDVRAPVANELRVKVSTFCVNFNDTDIVRGRWATVPLEPPFTPGMEAMGVVESAGPGAEHLVGKRIVGYASDISNDGAPLSPGPAVYGNFSLLGVCLAYALDPLATRLSIGLNLPSRAKGLIAHRRILDLLRAGTVRTVVTSEISFDELPEAMERQERRETMGRTVVKLG